MSNISRNWVLSLFVLYWFYCCTYGREVVGTEERKVCHLNTVYTCVTIKNTTALTYTETGGYIGRPYINTIFYHDSGDTTEYTSGVSAHTYYDSGGNDSTFCEAGLDISVIRFDFYDDNTGNLLGEASANPSLLSQLGRLTNIRAGITGGDVTLTSTSSMLFDFYQTGSPCLRIINGTFISSSNWALRLWFTNWRYDNLLHWSTSTSAVTFEPEWDETICFYSNSSFYLYFLLIDKGANLYDWSTEYRYLTHSTYGSKPGVLSVEFTEAIQATVYFEFFGCREETFNIYDYSKELINAVTTSFLVTIIIAGVLLILTAFYFSVKRFAGSDPVNYFAVIWMVMEWWDFWSDVAFVWLLFLDKQRAIASIMILFMITTYVSNLMYLTHLLQVYGHPSAPGYTRNWLTQWSWSIIFSTLCFGGVHPALELANSVLFPHDFFGMHLPYSEVIRVRTERFVTNVITENVPTLIMQFIYYMITNSQSRNTVVFWGTVVSTVLSILFSATYFFAHRSGNVKASAVYSFSFRVSSQKLQSFHVHSHWNMSAALQNMFRLRSATLVIMDQFHPTLVDKVTTLQVEGRILKDVSRGGRRLSTVDALANCAKDGNDDSYKNDDALRQQLAKIIEVELHVSDCTVETLNVMALTNERVYFRKTPVKKCCFFIGFLCRECVNSTCPKLHDKLEVEMEANKETTMVTHTHTMSPRFKSHRTGSPIPHDPNSPVAVPSSSSQVEINTQRSLSLVEGLPGKRRTPQPPSNKPPSRSNLLGGTSAKKPSRPKSPVPLPAPKSDITLSPSISVMKEASPRPTSPVPQPPGAFSLDNSRSPDADPPKFASVLSDSSTSSAVKSTSSALSSHRAFFEKISTNNHTLVPNKYAIPTESPPMSPSVGSSNDQMSPRSLDIESGKP